jgi:hypothetical protein
MKHITGYRPSQDRRLFGSKSRPWAPGEGPPKPPSTLYPGSNVRILSTAPQWAFGPDPPPVYPGPTPPPPQQPEQRAPAKPEPIQSRVSNALISNEPSTPEAKIGRASSAPDIKDIKEIVAPDQDDQAALEPIQPTQPEPEDAINEMTKIPSTTAHDEPIEEEPVQDEAGPQPIYLEDLDPHTQRVVYSVMANAPERGLGPKALFGTRSIEPPIHPEETEPTDLPAPEPVERRPAKPIEMKRHVSHCTICKHPERAAIDQAFLHWWPIADLAYHFKLGNRLVVYRHAHALGLFETRRARTQHALGYMIEQAQTVTPTGDCIIRAIRALSCLDENGRWHEPRKEVLIMHQYLDTPAQRPNPEAPLLGKPAQLLDTPAPALNSQAPLLDTATQLLDTPAAALNSHPDTPSQLLDTRVQKKSGLIDTESTT